MSSNENSLDNGIVKASTDDDASTTVTVVAIKRQKYKHIMKWKIYNIVCKTAEAVDIFPSTKFEFKLGPNMLFEANIKIYGKDCLNRKLNLELNNLSQKNWRVNCKIEVNNFAYTISDMTEGLTFKEILLTSMKNDDCVLKDGLNIVTCEFVNVDYIEIEQPALRKIQTSSLQTDMEQLFASKRMGDIIFEVKGQILTAHKLILVSRSKYFADMLKQCDMKNVVMPNIIVSDIEPHVFNEILRYIYTDKVSDINEMAEELLIASNKYGLENLKLVCEAELINKINAENASDLLILASENAAKDLELKATTFIA